MLLFQYPDAQMHADGASIPDGLLESTVPHDEQTVLPLELSFHQPLEQPPDASLTQCLVDGSHHVPESQSEATTGQTDDTSSSDAVQQQRRVA
jgi:hypothetical protein